MARPRSLIVDDDPEVLQVLAEFVKREGFAVTTATTLNQAREAITADPPDIVLIDIHLPDGSGLDLLDPSEPAAAPEVVLITGNASVESAVDALRRGAADYLTKPVDFARLKMVLANLARTLEMKGEIGTLRNELRKLGRFGALIGACPAMQGVYDLIDSVARSDASIFITGETGTGKEVVAQTIHALSRRRKEAFLPVNCGAISANLIESELFGHERGSFTGAERQHRGFFERANRGTLLLDEISEMPLELQVKLLRLVETSAVTRVGGNEPIAGRRAHHRRQQPTPRGCGRGGKAAEGPALPAERLSHRAPSAAGARSRRGAAGRAFPGRAQRGGRDGEAAHARQS